MIAKSPSPSTGPRERHRQECARVLRQLKNGLIDKARARGGRLNEADIEDALATIMRQSEIFDGAFDMMANEYAAKAQRREFAAMREDNFGRLLVSRFAHLLEGREAGQLADGALSRRILAPFFQAIHMIVGAETLDRLKRQIDDLIPELEERDLSEDDPRFWLTLTDVPDTATIVHTVFLTLALCFDDYERRKRWFIDLINDNMPHPPTRRGAVWWFRDDHFAGLMQSLFRDIRALIVTEAGVREISDRFGGDAIERLHDLFMKLDADAAAQEDTRP